METTPLSSRRVTRSQTLAASANPLSSKRGECLMKSNHQHQDRSALVDITNDSPIVGVAMGSKTVSSAAAKKAGTPGSGEALLRGQVKTLLQKVEEEGDVFSMEKGCFFNLQMNIVAPTPANTPQIAPQMIMEKMEEFDVPITRSLLFDFLENSEGDDVEEDTCYYDEDDEDEDEGKYNVDELCEEMSKISVGKHIRYVYNSDDEIETEQVSCVVGLRGLPTPKGKHIRFIES